jgi:centrosomal protein POC5
VTLVPQNPVEVTVSLSFQAELSQMKIIIIEQSKKNLTMEKERHGAEMEQTRNEMENLKELLHTYETSIDRKDEVISNLTRALQRHKEKFEMMRTFCGWRIKHNDTKREVSTRTAGSTSDGAT